MVFFLGAEDKVYGRYGGRDAEGPDERQSLDGLRYTMNSVLEMHRREDRQYAPREEGPPKYVRDYAGGRGCTHCHQVREAIDDGLRRAGKWSRELAWRYPLPDNLGVLLEVDRGNVVRRVEPGSPAARAGLERGDVVRRLGDVPVHSLADAQFALDRAPPQGEVAVAWERQGKARAGALPLPAGWRKGDITWRPSLRHLVPSLPVFGEDLTAEQKKALGLRAEQLAFRQRDRINPRAEAAGIRPGDIVLGVDDRKLDGMDAGDLYQFVRREYLVGDQIQIDLLRDGKRLRLPVTLR